MKKSELQQIIKEEIVKILNEESSDFPPRSLTGIFLETADNKEFYLDEIDQPKYLKCMYAAYKLGKSSGTWK